MKSEEKRKILKSLNMGSTIGSAIFAGSPLFVIIIASIIFGVIGVAVAVVTNLLKILSRLLIKSRIN